MKALRIIGRALIIIVLLWFMFFAWLFSVTGLRKLWFKATRWGVPYEPLRNEALVRRVFEILGPTFIKLGQVIASSPGLFPKRYSEEFAKCLDRVPPFKLEVLKRTIHEDLGDSVDNVFESFEETPLGSASIAQVHAATLSSGERVVVKVQRPGILAKVDADLWWMKRGAWILDKLFKGARLANVKGVIADFDRTIHEELDFRKEAANLTEFNELMDHHKVTDVKAPKPVDELVTERVLTMERFDGFKADDVGPILAAGIDPEVYIRKGLRAWLLTMMLHGFFHGDAHAGNLMLLPQGPAVGFLDFGIIGRFTTEQRHQVLRYVLAFAVQDYEELADVMSDIGSIEAEKIDREAFVKDLHRTYGPLIEKNVADIKYEEILPDISRVAYQYGVKLPSEFLLILKQLLFFDRYAKLAAPNLNVFSDPYLVDFLFTPAAMQSGLDFNVLMPLLQKVQQRFAEAQAKDAAAAAAKEASGAPAA